MKRLLSLALLISAISVYSLYTADDALHCSDQPSKATVIDQEDLQIEKCKCGCSSSCCGSKCSSGCCGCRSAVVESAQEDLTASICPCKARCKNCNARCKSCTCDATTCKRSISDESCICLDGTPRACECEDTSLCKQDCSCCTKGDSAEMAAVLCACEQKRSEDIDSAEDGESQE